MTVVEFKFNDVTNYRRESLRFQIKVKAIKYLGIDSFRYMQKVFDYKRTPLTKCYCVSVVTFVLFSSCKSLKKKRK